MAGLRPGHYVDCHHVDCHRPALDRAAQYPEHPEKHGEARLAGPNPTHASVISALRNLKSYNGNGILAQSINYSTIFGHDLPKACGWYMKAEKNGFVATSSQPTCGTDLPNTTTVQG